MPKACLTYGRDNSARSAIVYVVFSMGLLALSIFLGLVASLGSVKIAVLLAGGIIAIGLLALSANQILLLLIILSFLVVGQLFYFAGYGQAWWIPYGMGIVLFAKLAMLKINYGEKQNITAISLFATLSIIATFAAYIVNQSPALQALAGGKNIVALWSVFFVIAAGFVSQVAIARIWKLFYWLLLFQVPLVLYQNFVVAPSRTTFGSTVGGVEWDAIVGGFGGDPEGGGASGTLAFFVCLVATYAIAKYRHGLITKLHLIAALVAAALCIALAEVKVAVVLIPIALITLVLLEARKRPLVFIIGLPLALVLGFSVLLAYERVHYQSSTISSSNPVEMIDKAFGYSLDPHQINYSSGEMGRVAAIVHWWDQVMERDLFHATFGYGPGASRGKSIVGAGEAARKYPFSIDRSAATQLLWDTGLLGFLSYFLALLVGAVQAYRIAARNDLANEEAAILKATTAGLAMMVIMLFYGRDILEVPAFSLLAMMLLGQVAWQRTLQTQARHPIPPASASDPVGGFRLAR